MLSFGPFRSASLSMSAAVILLVLGACAGNEPPPAGIFFNQVGSHPDGPRIAVVRGVPADSLKVVSVATGETVLAVPLSPLREQPWMGPATRLADWSVVRNPGRYRLEAGELDVVAEIRPDSYRDVAVMAARSYFFLRCSMALPAEYAGPWARPAGHPDTAVAIHPSAAEPHRPAGTRVAAPGGWYDAGDYNKYPVNAAVTTATLMSVLEEWPESVPPLGLDIPESGNALPDVFDEVLWNLRWMLAMQDPHDGGVYHKLTTAQFEPFVMPHEAQSPRWLVAKSTAATLDAAAVFAQAARLAERYPAVLPGLADSCRTAALAAWTWARRHPGRTYRQSVLNAEFDPDVQTGAYGDRHLDDEWYWAAVELAVTTARDSFLTVVADQADEPFSPASWAGGRAMGDYTLLRYRDRLDERAADLAGARKAALLAWGSERLAAAGTNPYRSVMGESERDFGWGSNGEAANRGMAMLHAWRESGNAAFREAAGDLLDYLLGRNPTGFCFVTGMGTVSPMFPHHRPSGADAVAAPVPGLLVGGPNPHRQDGVAVPAGGAALAYVDVEASYATNETAINWNAPLVYLAAMLEMAFTETAR